MQSATGSQLDVSLSNEAFGGSTVLVHASASRPIGMMVDSGLKVSLTLRRPTASGRQRWFANLGGGRSQSILFRPQGASGERRKSRISDFLGTTASRG